MFTAKQVMCQALGGKESSHVPRWWKEHPGLRDSGSITVYSCAASDKSEDLRLSFLSHKTGTVMCTQHTLWVCVSWVRIKWAFC